MLVEHGEDSRIDRKKTLRLDTRWHQMEFVKDVMAFANGHENLPAYILTGVDEEGGLHDIGETLPDEATLQQLVSSHLDPPVLFSLTQHTLRGVRLGVIRIEPSTARFHMGVRDVNDASNKPLLRQGEILIRRGTAKMPLRPLDMQRLKEEFARRQVPQPELAVRFAGEAEEVSPGRSFPTADHLMTRTLGHFLVRSQFGFFYHLLPLRFFVHNFGQAQAETLIADITFPRECQVVFPKNDEHRVPAWSIGVQRSRNAVRIRGGALVHGDWNSPGIVYIRCPRREQSLTLQWTATAGKLSARMTGSLYLHVLR